MSDTETRQRLLDECRTISENALYTAQAHYEEADVLDARERLKRWSIVALSFVAAVLGLLVAFDLPAWLGGVGAFISTIVGIIGLLGVDRKAEKHRQAATALTALRHDARSLHEAYAPLLTLEQLAHEARRLGDRYTTLCEMSETPTNAAFERGRARIKAGTFEMDFRQALDQKHDAPNQISGSDAKRLPGEGK